MNLDISVYLNVNSTLISSKFISFLLSSNVSNHFVHNLSCGQSVISYHKLRNLPPFLIEGTYNY